MRVRSETGVFHCLLMTVVGFYLEDGMTPPLLLLSVSHARYTHTCITCTCTTCTVCTRRCTRPCKGVSVNQTGTSFSNPPWGDPTPAGFPLCGAPAAPGVTRAPAAGGPPLSPPPLPPPCAHAQAQRPLWATGTSLQGKTRFLLLVPARALPGAWQTFSPAAHFTRSCFLTDRNHCPPNPRNRTDPAGVRCI